ncbi:phospholipid carrier-dependent glycosyltransferase [Echinimonas agarilytica]|uniref:Glycosyltransferase family 39 protein n=1 Tax=Echinimonas agarilytica TaxID=1215918 RepID=A0AA41WBI9_9GAMM|nr:phospholipid carrier-dependent glycosyltransferase [Echinimonas agarilytica]MCM2681478.1 glycosyltransferase family 39 protein [Echinimonas agarilytica]
MTTPNILSAQSLSLGRNDWFALLGLALLCIVLRSTYALGFAGSDDAVIITNAIRLLNEGMYLPTGHYNARFGMIMPIAGVFSVFGIGLQQISLLPIALSVGITTVCYLTARRIGLSLSFALFAAAMTTLMPVFVQYGASNYPEIYFAFWVAVSFFILVCAIHNKDRNSLSPLILGLLFMSLFFAYMVKIEAVFICFGYAFAFALLKRWKDMAWVLLFVLLFFLYEDILVYYSETGKFFNRADMVTAKSTKMAVNKAYGHAELWTYLKAMFVTFYNFGLYFYFVVAAVIGLLLQKKKLPAVIIIALVSSAIFYGWLQFGTSPKGLIKFLTTGKLNNKSQLARYLIMIAPFCSIFVAYFLAQISYSSKFKQYFPQAILVLSMVAFLPLNDIGNEVGLTYQQAVKKLSDQPDIKVVYTDRATYTYLRSVQQFGELEHLSVQPIVHHNMQSGRSKVNPDFIWAGGYALIHKNRYLYHNRRYKVQYPTLESMAINGDKQILVANPASSISYGILNTIKQVVILLGLEQNYIGQKVVHTADEALDPEDMLLIDVNREHTDRLTYLDATPAE